MKKYILRISRCAILFCWMAILLIGASHAQEDEGPFGLHWGMSKEEVTNMNIRLCCGQLGKWGMRYQVNQLDFKNLPKSLGDEEKMYLYFGNKNELLRIYVAITKINGLNRYRQISLLLEKRYDSLKRCGDKEMDNCENYKTYTHYKKGDIEVFVGFEENLTYRDKISIIFMHGELFKADEDFKNPF